MRTINKMINPKIVFENFKKNNGIMKLSELKSTGLNDFQIKKMVNDGLIRKLKRGVYEVTSTVNSDDIVISKVFPNAIIFLESALFYYHYIDRVPKSWQVAVDRDKAKAQYKIDYPSLKPFYLESKYLEIGLTSYERDGIVIKIYDRERTMIDLLRYEKKIDSEVYIKAIKSYIQDSHKNARKLFDYAKIFNITYKVQTQIGLWL